VSKMARDRTVTEKGAGSMKAWLKASVFVPLATILAFSPVIAQTPQNAPGALPVPPAPFGGFIGKTYADSEPAFPKQVAAPANAPNVMIFLTDDVGFGAASAFGGLVPTPNLDRLANQGLRYNRFHTTAMCSPTRAALLTGRNHHAVGNGIVANLTTGFPGYWSEMPRSAASVAEILRLNGYNTAMFGKHHLGPESVVSTAGPFDDWPTRLGFDYFYGFVAAETNQFKPALYRGTSPVPTLKDGVLDQALADDAIHWIRNQNAAAPDKPFFLYYSTGSTHAPVQAPAEWIAKFRGKFDAGWDVLSKEIMARQEKMGMVPKGTKSRPRPAAIPAWSTLSPTLQKVNARAMEVFAGMLAYQDAQVGRVLDELDRTGEGKNTLIFFIEGDNGAPAEGGANGSTNPFAGFANGFKESDEQLLAAMDSFGGPDANLNYGFGWAWLLSTPFPMFKQYASHLGGTRNGLVVSWPGHIRGGGTRSQFTHVTDIVPTILEEVGIAQPSIVNGAPQQRMDGISFGYSFSQPQAPERKTTQYFEMMGNRAIYHDGWWANTTPGRLPWMKKSEGLPTDYKWELYDLKHDFAQANDLAAKQPDKLREMQALFDAEAQRNNVFPLDDRMTPARFLAAQSAKPRRDHYTYWGSGITMPYRQAAPLFNRSFTLTADVLVPQQPISGSIVALGGSFGGWGFYLKENRPTALMAASQRPEDQFRVAATKALAPGRATLTYRFSYDGGVNGGGEMRISRNGEEIARGRIDRTISQPVELTDTLDVGMDVSTQMTSDYPEGGVFDGIQRVDIDLGPVGASRLNN
jgi:arylsulfatase A-like enzyme